MPQDQVLLILIGVLVVANLLLLAWTALRARRQRRSSQGERVQPGRRDRMETLEDARAAAAIEAFVSGEPASPARPPAPWELIPPRREPVTTPAPKTLDTPDRTPAGIADPSTWDRAIREESARVARFGRPVTVVMAELRHLDDVADRLGRDVAERVVTETARLLTTDGRAVERIAWLGDARFGVLLLETDETVAGQYVDRVRAAVDGWLESAGLSVRLSFGWASPVEGGDVMTAAAVAQQRMHDADRRAQRSWSGPTLAVSGVTATSNR
jgi:diguanylate cyclase (GGDEF)-like protein